MNDQSLNRPATTQTRVRVQLYQNGFLEEEWRFTNNFRIGRDPDCEVCLDIERVSRNHAEVRQEGGAWWVRDLGSRNGTLLNGGQVDRARLGNPSTLQIAYNGPVLQITMEEIEVEELPARPTGPMVTEAIPFDEIDEEAYEETASKWNWKSYVDTLKQPGQPAPPPKPVITPAETTQEVQPEQATKPLYPGHGFSMPLPEGWSDQTVYILTGPVTGGIQHNITINVDDKVGAISLVDYVDWQLRSLSTELKGYDLLKKEAVTLDCGIEAYRVVYRWQPAEERTLYQEQVYVVHQETGYKLTTTFSKKTRQMLGASIGETMLQFAPTARLS